MAKVLDSHALLTYLQKEPGYEKVKDILSAAAESDKRCLMTVVNWGEVFYIILRAHGPAKADEIARVIATFPLTVIDVDMDLARQAAVFKATARIAYADCFAAGLAKLKHAELVTGDDEFKRLEKDIEIQWIK